jgi:hypothetical protein
VASKKTPSTAEVYKKPDTVTDFGRLSYFKTKELLALLESAIQVTKQEHGDCADLALLLNQFQSLVVWAGQLRGNELLLTGIFNGAFYVDVEGDEIIVHDTSGTRGPPQRRRK